MRVGRKEEWMRGRVGMGELMMRGIEGIRYAGIGGGIVGWIGRWMEDWKDGRMNA
jgi:hypothetical protein